MSSIQQNIEHITAQIASAQQKCGRAPNSVQLLAVSKTKPVEAILEAAQFGQRAFGENYVRFGILHAIAASSLIALPFVRFPSILTYAAAFFVWSLPKWAASPAFDGQLLLWSGLGTPSFGSVDYVPLAPWTAATLLGVAVATSPHVQDFAKKLGTSPYSNRTGRFLVLCGRWSLVIYLLHQPVLFGLVSSLATAGLAPDRTATLFLESCTQNCTAARGDEAQCTKACSCTLLSLQNDSLWQPLLQDPENQDLRRELDTRYTMCSRDPDTLPVMPRP